MEKDINKTVQVSKLLREKLDPLFSENLSNSQIIVDLADIHEICSAYLKSLDKIIHGGSLAPSDIEDIFYDIDCDLFEHLPFHLDSLKKLLSQAIDEVGKKGQGSDTE